MALDWLPVYPTKLERDRGLTAAFGPPFAGQSLPASQITARLWSESQPTFPSQHLRRPLRPAGSWVQPFVIAAAATVPPLAWSPVYPNQTARLRMPVAARPSLFAVPTITVPADTKVGWLPVYPSALSRRTVHPSTIPSMALTIVPAPATQSWHAVYPDAVASKAGLSASRQSFYAFYPVPVPQPIPPGIGYRLTIYPDRVPGKASIRAGAQQTYVSVVLPIPNAAAPTFSWQGIYPTQTIKSARQQPQTQHVGVFEASLLADVRWLTNYPSQILRRVTMPVSQAVGALLSQFVIPTVHAWGPSYPDVLFRRLTVAPVLAATDLFFATATTVPSTATCLKLTQELGGQPRLVNEILGTPSLSRELGSEGSFTAEEEC